MLPPSLAHMLPSLEVDSAAPRLCRVTEIEAVRLEESREEREEFLRSLRAELERQAAERHVSLRIPEAPQPRGER